MAGGVNLSLEALGVNLPYSMEAEQAVLGAALIDAELIPKMVESLRPEMFYARQNGEIFSEMMRLFTASSPVDFVTLLAAVQDAGVFATEDEAKVYLTQLAETVPALSHTDTYIKIIGEKYRVRQLMQAAKTAHGSFFARCARLLRQNPAAQGKEICQKALAEEKGSCPFFRGPEKEALADLFLRISTAVSGEQIEDACAVFIRQTDLIVKDLRAQQEQKGRLTKTLCTVAGLIVSILLV